VGPPGSTYTVSASDVGHTIEVWETGMDSTGTTILESGPTLAVGPPVNTSAPGITGTAQQGQTLTEIPGTWPGAQPPVAIQWQDCNGSGQACHSVAANGNGSTYMPTSLDVGSTIEVQEIGSNLGGPGNPVNSLPTSVVAPPSPVNLTLPTISGTTQAGQTLTETNGSWNPTPTGFSYQWLDCNSTGNNCASVAANGTGQTYVVASTDVGSTIRVAETAFNGVSAGTPADSAPSAVVVPATTAVPVNQSLPTISGTTQLGQTLIEGHGIWSPAPTSYGYQWLRCDSSANNCAAIHSATGPSYLLTSADVNNTIEVEETASVGGSAAAADSGPTATVTATGVNVPSSSTTALLALPASPVTNQTVSLIATVTSSSSAAPPDGNVAFEVAGTAISGCSSVPVATFSQSMNVTCSTAFSASTSPEHLTAVFTPAVGSGLTGSTSQSLTVVVGQGSTSTTLDVNPTLFAGSKATYTATVDTGQAQPFQPSGSVQFSDHGKPIASCSGQPLQQNQGSLSARCTVRYRKSGRHTITAQYSGDGGFGGSASPSQSVRVEQRPTQIAGAITAKTSWTDYFTPTYTRFLAMLVHKLRSGTTIVFICRGQGCPFARQSLLVTSKACGSRASCVTEQGHVVDLLPRLRRYRLRVGTVLTIELTRPDWIGKAYVIKIRSGRKPTDQIKCLAPGSTRPGEGC
jgi:hypothetical protein